MKTQLLPEGGKFIGEVLAGSQERINGMYIEYADTDVASVDGRSAEYYENLLHSAGAGYGRIAVKDVTCAGNGIVTVTGVVTSTDLKGGKIGKNSKLVAATLVHMADDKAANDRLLYSALLSSPVKIVKGVYNYIQISFSIG